jgi:23S rRNA pseudouridine1911/1915/1917 synthase
VITETDIIFEDNHIIVVNKKSGQIVQGDKTGDAPMNDLLKDFLKAKYEKPGNVFIGTAHRIDRPVSGIVLFAKTSKALARINEMFQNKEIQKKYWCIVKNKPKNNTGLLVDFLLKNEKQNKSYVVKPDNKSALKCELEYKVLQSSDNYHLLEINPLTGRHHQIRAQLSHAGFPIKGDLKYGFDRSNPDGSICLHARQLNFIHPVKKEPVEIIAPVPEEKLWQYFEKLLK